MNKIEQRIDWMDELFAKHQYPDDQPFRVARDTMQALYDENERLKAVATTVSLCGRCGACKATADDVLDNLRIT